MRHRGRISNLGSASALSYVSVAEGRSGAGARSRLVASTVRLRSTTLLAKVARGGHSDPEIGEPPQFTKTNRGCLPECAYGCHR